MSGPHLEQKLEFVSRITALQRERLVNPERSHRCLAATLETTQLSFESSGDRPQAEVQKFASNDWFTAIAAGGAAGRTPALCHRADSSPDNSLVPDWAIREALRHMVNAEFNREHGHN